jgi:hypothetical protein
MSSNDGRMRARSRDAVDQSDVASDSADLQITVASKAHARNVAQREPVVCCLQLACSVGLSNVGEMNDDTEAKAVSGDSNMEWNEARRVQNYCCSLKCASNRARCGAKLVAIAAARAWLCVAFPRIYMPCMEF